MNPLSNGKLLVDQNGTHVYDDQMNYLGTIASPTPAPVAPPVAQPAPVAPQATPVPQRVVAQPVPDTALTPENLEKMQPEEVGKAMLAGSSPVAKDKPDRELYEGISKAEEKRVDEEMRKKMEGGALM